MYAFVDETGKTGANVFDDDQPDFYTAGLLTRKDFDAVYGVSWRNFLAVKGLQELHANQVGHGQIEEIATGVQDFLRKSGARFHMTRVEKSYLLAGKVFDTFFDSGENAAMSWMHYNIKNLRLPLVGMAVFARYKGRPSCIPLRMGRLPCYSIIFMEISSAHIDAGFVSISAI